MNEFLVGIQCALEEYPFVGDDFERLFHKRFVSSEDQYKECLYLLLDVYRQYEEGKIPSETVFWAMKKLREILGYEHT